MNLKEQQQFGNQQFIKECDQVLHDWFTVNFSDQFHPSLLLFKSKIGSDNVFYNLQFACEKIDEPCDAILYFCKICWNQIKGNDND